MADTPEVAETKKELAKGNEVKWKINEAASARMNVKPTPTQEEADLAALGAPVQEKEPDGSEPDHRNQPIQTRVLAAQPNPSSGGYSTRGHRSASHASSTTPSS